MRLYRPVLMLLPILLMVFGPVSLAGADRHKPEIDPESQDGILLQRIRQEPLAARKLALLEKFVELYPNVSSVAWIYEQLLPIYLEQQNFDKTLVVADSLLTLDPLELDAAHGALRAAEAKQDPDLIAKYAQVAWDVASKTVGSPKPTDPDDVTDWTAQIAFARDVMNYSEYELYTLYGKCTDQRKKDGLLQAIKTRNPQSRYLENPKKQYLTTVERTGSPEQTLAIAEKGLLEEPENEEMLMIVAQYYLQRERELPKVLSCALKIIEILDRKQRPNAVNPDDWANRKAQYVGLSNWMAGVVYAKDGRYGPSDRYLRTALAQVREAGLLSAAYYYLGYDNYAMATELHDRARALDSVKYNKLCLTINGPFQALARKNLDVLKSEFNVE